MTTFYCRRSTNSLNLLCMVFELSFRSVTAFSVGIFPADLKPFFVPCSNYQNCIVLNFVILSTSDLFVHLFVFGKIMKLLFREWLTSSTQQCISAQNGSAMHNEYMIAICEHMNYGKNCCVFQFLLLFSGNSSQRERERDIEKYERMKNNEWRIKIEV